MSMEGDASGGLDAAVAYAWEVGLTRKEIEEQVHFAINREEQDRPRPNDAANDDA